MAVRTPSGEPIMTAKLRVPGTQPWTIARHRLLDRVSLGVAGPLTLITAPAGAGKTILASSWVHAGAAPGPVVWLSLDEQDDQVGTLWSYILAGLSRAGVPVGQVGVPSRTDPADRSLLIRLAAGLAEQIRPVTLVLDDAQVLGESAIFEGLDFVLRHAGPQLRLVVLSRREPGLPVHRYRVAGSLVHIRLLDLAFTVPEAQSLLTAHGVDVPHPDVARLVQRTTGWAAGVRLAALGLMDTTSGRRSTDISGDLSTDVEDYFVAEVLNAQPADTRDFMLRTSVVDRIWPELAAELSGHRDAPRTLAVLAHTDTFITAPTVDRGSYEYHPIVRDLLRSQLRHESPNTVAQLHRKAAHWLADAGQATDAIIHAAAAGDWAQAANLVVDDLSVGRLIAGPPAGRLGGVLAGMPPDLADPAVAVVQAALALVRGDAGGCAKHLLRAAELVGDATPEGDDRLRLSAVIVEVVCARLRCDAEATLAAAATAEAAFTALAGRGVAVPADIPALVRLNRGRALLHRGDFGSAAAALTAALTAADGPGAEHLRPDILSHLAIAEVLRGHLRRATGHAQRAGAAAAACGAAGLPAVADVALAWVRVEEYELQSARGHADRLADAVHPRPDPVTAGLLAVVRGRLSRARGDAAEAAATMARAAAADSTPDWLRDRLRALDATLRAADGTTEPADTALRATGDPETPHRMLALATIRLAEGAAFEANELVSSLLARSGATLDVRVDAWLLVTSGELLLGRTERARSALAQALDLAKTERLRRPIIEAPQRLRRFLRRERGLMDQHGWLEATAIRSNDARPSATVDEPGPRRGQQPVVEPLTVKETEVLRYLAALLSTEEIALKMFISVNTVRTHIRGVLRKLAASRRNEAIRRARDLGLVQ